MKRSLIECLGSFFLVFMVAMGTGPLAVAAMLMAWVYIGGYISGAHYNPAVSLAAAYSGKLHRRELGAYMLAQIVGGCLAYILATFLLGHIHVPAPAAGVTIFQAFIVEILLAFVLSMVVLTVATSKKYAGNYVFGFAIGFTIPALAALGQTTSGGLFNPAIAIGSATVGLFYGVPLAWDNLFMYVIGALLGGLLAAHAFKYFVLDEER
jgi:aquaporin Z